MVIQPLCNIGSIFKSLSISLFQASKHTNDELSTGPGSLISPKIISAKKNVDIEHCKFVTSITALTEDIFKELDIAKEGESAALTRLKSRAA